MRRCSEVMFESRRRVIFFFFKQKTAYEVLRSLVGSELCIGDSGRRAAATRPRPRRATQCAGVNK